MRAYVYDDIPGDQRLPHDSGNPVAQNTLKQLGVIYRTIPIDDEKRWESEIDEFAKERNYKNRDQITVTKAGLGEAYEDKIKSFFDEHLHEDEEIRYILAGSGYFDIRGLAPPYDDRWIRIALEKGDLIVLPAGSVSSLFFPLSSVLLPILSVNRSATHTARRIYHRFTVDEADTITAMRLFQDEPKWVPHSRAGGETDSNTARSGYVAQVKGALGIAA
ncbi:hypothetical protein P7C73_g4992, partial [Tremellales sp. Uapishka_1]